MRFLPLILPFALWQLAVWAGLFPLFVLPAPLDVFETLFAEWRLLGWHLLITLGETAGGMLIGVSLGIAVAVSLSLSPRLHHLSRPLLVASQALPVFVLAPVLTLWFGYGPAPKVAMAVLLVFFPVASGLLDGLLSTPREVLDLGRMAGAGRWRELRWLRLPHALGHLGAGLRIAVTYAPTGAIIGEWVGASQGLGYLMLVSNARMRVELMFAALILVVAMTVILNLVTDRLLRRFGI